ncbi:MAG: HNH endonuclease [Xanthobacteraceae bacterium]
MAGWPYNTTAWRNLRRAKLATEPLCEVCKMRGKTVLARAVDHIVAINAGGPAFPSLDGLRSMCDSCHNYKTNVADRPDRQAKLGSAFKGCDINGNPIGEDW